MLFALPSCFQAKLFLVMLSWQFPYADCHARLGSSRGILEHRKCQTGSDLWVHLPSILSLTVASTSCFREREKKPCSFPPIPQQLEVDL